MWPIVRLQGWNCRGFRLRHSVALAGSKESRFSLKELGHLIGCAGAIGNSTHPQGGQTQSKEAAMVILNSPHIVGLHLGANYDSGNSSTPIRKIISRLVGRYHQHAALLKLWIRQQLWDVTGQPCVSSGNPDSDV